ncbi:MAG: hypothetical protein NC820_01205 [Candidatus Omnitrophica bacterium]|nr:hypothetical protein [Candidatus Omnitrophota bacterium]
MEVNLEGLIEKIKREGVEEAKKTSQEIIRKAEEEAKSIKEEAQKNAQEQLEKAKKEIEHFRKTAQNSLQQAARDIILLVRQKIIELCDYILKREVSNKLDSQFLGEIILKVIDKWVPQEDIKLELQVSSEDKKRLEEFLFSRLREDLKNSLEIKIRPEIKKGFRIKIEGEDLYYDFSDEAISEALYLMINPALSQILSGKNG